MPGMDVYAHECAFMKLQCEKKAETVLVQHVSFLVFAVQGRFGVVLWFARKSLTLQAGYVVLRCVKRSTW